MANIGPYRGVLIDITGVLKEGDRPIPGSVEALHRLQSARVPFRLLTNESQVTTKMLVQQLHSFGYSISEEDIFMPATALVQILKETKEKPHLLVHPSVKEVFSDLELSDPSCVVIGDAAEYFTYDNLNKAFNILLHADNPRLYALGKGKYYSENGSLVLDVGAFTAALEYASGVHPVVIGKPSREYFSTALKSMGIESKHAVMVGDDIAFDIGGAQDCSIDGILVRTGKYRPCDEQHVSVRPKSVANNFQEAVHYILQHIGMDNGEACQASSCLSNTNYALGKLLQDSTQEHAVKLGPVVQETK